MCKRLRLLGFTLLILILMQMKLPAEEIKNLKVTVKDFISLTWDSPGGDTQGYDLYRSSSPDIRGDYLGKKINRKILLSNKYTDYSAGTGKIHYYQVYALDKEKNLVAFSTPVAGYISPFYSVNIWTPTAFQSKKVAGEHLVRTKYLFAKKPIFGLNVDFVTNYYIGRLFGKNNPNDRWEKDRYDYITRVGIWLFTIDGKVIFPYLEKKLFSLACGARYTFMYNDKPAPSPGGGPEFVIKPEKSIGLQSNYVVVTKVLPRIVFHFGTILGREEEIIPQLSEYVLKYLAGEWKTSKNIIFFGLNTRLIPRINLKIEAIHPLDNPLQPWLFNLDFGRFLPANFQLAYFRYKYGWDILGYFNFRYTFYPPQK
ncbi:MAG TPA: hypothetical protein DHV62_07985 [Elusimicrobia bacterium]|nr:hypothetical protein [Elusimicrobiota bacterium]